MTDTMQFILTLLIVAVWLKAITGFHFPWEKCKCCGKSYSEHDAAKFD